MKPIIFGYLHKLGRNNKWQKRWFESDGTALKYFKSKKKDKCLATLDLLRVGTIAMDRTDSAGCTFKIEVAGRHYYLCADTKERAMDWVITLNRVREARAQIGGLKLIKPEFIGQGRNQSHKQRRGSDSDEENVAPRVVMSTTRPRTKGLGKEDFSDMEKSVDDDERGVDVQLMMTNTTMSPSAGTGSLGSSSPRHSFLHPQLKFLPHNMQNQVSVRWTKQRSSVQNWVRRLSRWAKRMTMVRCVIKDDVVHLNHLHNHGLYMHGDDESACDDISEQPFIDLDIARYSNGPESFTEVCKHIVEAFLVSVSFKPTHLIPLFSYHNVKGHLPDAPASQPKYRFVDNNTNTSSWKVQKADQASAGSSIQSSSGRMSPIAADDDSSGIIA
jgi:PH domain.